ARSAPLTASRCGAFYAASSTTTQISTTGENRPTTTAKYAGGTRISGSYGDIDALFREQAIELDRRKREAGLQRIQQLIHEKAAVAPIQEVASLTGVGPHVEQSALGLIAGYAFFSAPYFPQPAGKDERAERRGDPPVQEVGSGFPLLLIPGGGLNQPSHPGRQPRPSTRWKGTRTTSAVSALTCATPTPASLAAR